MPTTEHQFKCSALLGCAADSARRLLTRAAIALLVLSAISPLATAQDRTFRFDPKTQQWVEEIPPPIGTPEGDLRVIREAVRAGEFNKALRLQEELIENYGPVGEAQVASALVRAEALIGKREHFKAYEELQAFLGEFGGGGELTEEALRLEMVIADAYLGGAKRKVLGLRLLSGIDVAYQILDEISAEHPTSPLAPIALKRKADHEFDAGEHDLAELDYMRLYTEFPESQYHEYALKRAADSALAIYVGPRYDDAPLIEAEERFREYRSEYPASAERDNVDLILKTTREARAEKDYLVGRYYEKTKHLRSAVFYYENVLKDWPGTIAATKSADRLELLGVRAPSRDDEAVTP